MGSSGALPRVAVVIPCWNAELWIARAIQSILDNGEAKLEVIVVDDGSTDASLEVIKTFGDLVRWSTGPNRGACATCNAGLAIAKADWVMFLDADDYLEPGSLSAWLESAIGHDADVLFGPFVYEQGKTRWPSHRPSIVADSQSILCDWLDGVFTPPCSVLWRRSFLVSVGGWNETVRRNQDGEVVMRALLSGARVCVVDDGCGVYVQHGSETRVSKRAGHEVVAGELSVFESLWRLARDRDCDYVRPAFARAFYRVAYEAYSTGVDKVGDEALRHARSLGLEGHVGSMAHRLLAGIFGLETKLKLTGWLKRGGRAKRVSASTSN